ncbi:MAG: hypothetical protein QOJ79_1195 [Actinomycetota bacterium]|nr:hypothetical protein [Actinomycetota bacterium]
MLAVALVAGVNMTASRRERARELAARDRVDATLFAAAGEAHDHAFEVTLLVVNHGSSAITVNAGRRVEPPLYDATPVEDRVVGPGVTEQLAVPFRARCPGQPEEPDRRLKLVVPIAPASGRVRDVSASLDPTMMWDLSRRACGYLRADEAAVPSVRDVTATHYTVRFKMLLANVSGRPFVLSNVTSPGLALSVLGGAPLAVAPHSDVDLAVAVALPACSRLPAPGPRGAGGLQFATIVLDLRDDTGAVQSKQFLPNADLSAALAGLRARICPGSLQAPSRTRPRGFGS